MVNLIIQIITEICANHVGNDNNQGMTIDNWRVARLTPLEIAALANVQIIHTYRMRSVAQATAFIEELQHRGIVVSANDNPTEILLVCYTNYPLL